MNRVKEDYIKREKSIGIKLYSVISCVLSVSIILYLLSFVFINGGKNISLDFILQKPKGMPIGSEGGVLPAIIGSFSFGIIAILTASVLALSVSIYICFYCKRDRLVMILRTTIGIIAGIPSIVLGLFGYSFFVVKLGFGMSLLAGGLVLGIMIFPYIEIRLEKIFFEIDKDIIRSSYALGVNKSYTIFKIILPMVGREILTTICLALSLALSVSAPLLITGAVMHARTPKDIFSPAMALPVHLYYLIGQGISVENAYATAFLMIVIVVILNIIPLMLFKKKY